MEALRRDQHVCAVKPLVLERRQAVEIEQEARRRNLMVGVEYQGRGYGRAAIEQALDLLKRQPDCREILISYMPENTVAERLYASLGFRPTGEIDDGEVVARLVVGR